MWAVTFLNYFLTSRSHVPRRRAWVVAGCVGVFLPNPSFAQGAGSVVFPPPSPPPQPVQSSPAAPVAPAPVPPAPFPVTPAPTAPAVSQPTGQPAAPGTPVAEPANPLALGVPAPGMPVETASRLPPLPNVGSGSPWPPAVLPYREGMPIVPGYRLESETRTGLALGGLTVFAVPYAAGLIAAAASGFTKDSGWLALPLAGPFVAMGGRSIDCSFTDVTGGDTTTDIGQKEADCRASALKEARVVALLTVAGLVQTAGAIITIAGLATQDKTLVRQDLYPAPTEPPSRFSVNGGYEQGKVRLTAQYVF